MEEQKTRCKAGQRAQVTKPLHGFNLGKIVHIICPYTDMNAAKPHEDIAFNGYLFNKGRYGFFWIVESLGSNLKYKAGTSFVEMMEGPFPDDHLTPLEEFDQDFSLWKAGRNSVAKQIPEHTEYMEYTKFLEYTEYVK